MFEFHLGKSEEKMRYTAVEWKKLKDAEIERGRNTVIETDAEKRQRQMPWIRAIALYARYEASPYAYGGTLDGDYTDGLVEHGTPMDTENRNRFERFFPNIHDLVNNRVPLAQTVINQERAARIAQMQQWNANYMRMHFAPG